MTVLGYHASHEQFPPSALLDWVQLAEGAGFEAAMCSDHFNPWSGAQGESGYSFAWLGAALQATSLPMGLVCTPGYRQHPAVVAQAIATLGELFPERIWAAFGSGQALNESITGERWPSKEERNRRLRECVEIIDALWAGERVTHHGLVDVVEATLHTRPDKAPRGFAAAVTAKTARWAADWADGLITVAHPLEEMKELVSAFRDHGGKDKELYLQMQVSYADSDQKALQNAHEQWGTNIFASSVLAELPSPKSFEAAAELVTPEQMQGPVRCSSSLEQHLEWIGAYADLGFDAIFLHNVGPNQGEFIAAFGEAVLPELIR